MLPLVSSAGRNVNHTGPGEKPGVSRILERSRRLLELGRPRAAAEEARKALALDPHHPEALQLHGLCLLRAGEVGPAMDALRAALAHAPMEAHTHYLLGYAQREAADVRAAEACYREALRLAPLEPVYLRALAELLTAGKHFAEALALAHRAVSLFPDRSTNHVTLGFVASSSGDRETARRAYQQALALDPNDAVAWNNLGCVDLAQGRPLQARSRFREALRLNPEGQMAQDNLRLVQAPARPPEAYRGYEAFEQQLVIEVCDRVFFRESGQARRPHAGRPEVQALALLLATEGRALPALLRRGSRLWWLLGGASVGLLRLLRLGPAGLVVAAGSGAATYLVSRKVLGQRRDDYRQRLVEVKAAYLGLQRRWLDGQILRQERDAAMDQLVDDFCRGAEG